MNANVTVAIIMIGSVCAISYLFALSGEPQAVWLWRDMFKVLWTDNQRTERKTMTPKKYRMLKDSKICAEAKAGVTVYKLLLNDYGLANDDTRLGGIKCISITLDPEGGYPFFTVPESHVEAIDAELE